MNTRMQDTPRRVDEAAGEFDEREQRRDGRRVAGNLAAGLSQLRNTLFRRIHDDVERIFGSDSMIMHMAPDKLESTAKAEIEIYQLAICIAECEERKHTRDAGWFTQWLTKLRLGEGFNSPGVAKRLNQYLEQTPEDRRLAFSNILERVSPEARRSPLVLHRLYPLAVQIVTAMAFGDHLRANDLRNQQQRILPSIGDCHDCHGRVLENGEACPTCGNPLWKFQWLNAAD